MVPDVTAYFTGPPPGHTGGFGEPTCQACHLENSLNDPTGALSLEGVPPRFTPGSTYVLTVRLSHPDMRRGGFQLSSRLSGGADPGTQGGTLRAADPRVTIDDGDDVAYAHHTETGTMLNGESTTDWQVEWVAPAAGEAAVTFHVAANATNDDGSEFGDHVYAVEAESESGS